MTSPAYFVISVDIRDPDAMRPYHAQVAQTLLPYGGQRIVAGALPDVFEGAPPAGKVVIVQFPSMAHAHAWHDSPAYPAIIGHRHAAGVSHAYLVEGVTAVASA